MHQRLVTSSKNHRCNRNQYERSTCRTEEGPHYQHWSTLLDVPKMKQITSANDHEKMSSAMEKPCRWIVMQQSDPFQQSIELSNKNDKYSSCKSFLSAKLKTLNIMKHHTSCKLYNEMESMAGRRRYIHEEKWNPVAGFHPNETQPLGFIFLSSNTAVPMVLRLQLGSGGV